MNDRATRRIARVLPDVTGLDKQFDYLVPDELATSVEVGSIVRVDLHGRRVGGWVVGLRDHPHEGMTVADLKPIAKVTGHGPSPALLDLADWAMVRWAAPRMRPFLVSASPHRAVTRLGPSRRTRARPEPASPATTSLLAAGGGVLRVPPRTDPLPAIAAAVRTGATLVVVPGHVAATTLAARLRRGGVSVALVPDEWAEAAAGTDVVIGSRVAAWAPCPGLAAALVLDEHDEALQEERAPTWHARDVLAERCRRAGAPLVAVSPIPTLTAIVGLSGPDGPRHPSRDRERAGWPPVTVVDRSGDEPWRRSLLTSPLIQLIRDRRRRVVCVSNTTGRARVLACRTCRALVRCERCDAAVGLADDGRLVCRRCGVQRPPVCQVCGAARFANLRPGVSRLREELAAAAARPVVAVTGRDEVPPPAADVYVGTEAVLHRVSGVDTVAFLEFDSEMLAPRFRAAEQALTLIVRAARVAREVMIQTFVPDHEVIRAAATGDPDLVVAGERARRELLGLPPFGALAVVSGAGTQAFADALTDPAVTTGWDGDRLLVRAADWMTLGRALNAVPRSPGQRVRVEVDPPRI